MATIQRNAAKPVLSTKATVKTIPQEEIIDAAAEVARMQVANPFAAKAVDFANAFSGEEIVAFMEEDLDREDERTRSTLHFMIHLKNANAKMFDALPRHDAAIGSNNPRYFKYEKAGKDGATVTKDDGDIYTEISRDHVLATPILAELAEIDADKSIDPSTKISRKATLNARLKRIKTLFVEAVTIRDMIADLKALPDMDAYIQVDEDGQVVATKTPIIVCSTKPDERTSVMPMPVSRFIGLEPEKAKGQPSAYKALTGATQRDRTVKASKYLPKNVNQFELVIFALHTYLHPLTEGDQRFAASLDSRLSAKAAAPLRAAMNELYDHLGVLLTSDRVEKALTADAKEETAKPAATKAA